MRGRAHFVGRAVDAERDVFLHKCIRPRRRHFRIGVYLRRAKRRVRTCRIRCAARLRAVKLRVLVFTCFTFTFTITWHSSLSLPVNTFAFLILLQPPYSLQHPELHGLALDASLLRLSSPPVYAMVLVAQEVAGFHELDRLQQSLLLLPMFKLELQIKIMTTRKLQVQLLS